MVHTRDFSKCCVFLYASTKAKERNPQPFVNSLVHTVYEQIPDAKVFLSNYSYLEITIFVTPIQIFKKSYF